MSLKLSAAMGFAAKAGKLTAGDFAVSKAVKGKKAKLVILDTDASDATKKKWHNACDFHRVKLIETNSPGEKLGKADNKVFAVIDTGFCKLICDAYGTENNCNDNMQN